MSAADVLAVMDAEIEVALNTCKSVHGSARLTALGEARAAVEELMGAATEFQESSDAVIADDYGSRKVYNRHHSARIRFDAALVRCKGES